ncbi:MAG: RpiB/LacA/LacB family sugar-phosphate isomerase [Candidatus Eremiobacteraeota bacterium]|nr:RpiB/LacA/LacB family sugar-phosphate isomerase [Candidatus Eremiobacteraeota bacterium]
MTAPSQANSVAFGSDDTSPLTDALLLELQRRGYRVQKFGAILDGTTNWPRIAQRVAKTVVEGDATFGVLCCWTGTGVSIAANKVFGARAALCGDAATAQGARRWNDANVLALSLRSTSIPVALEILDAFIAAQPSTDPGDIAAIEAIEANATVREDVDFVPVQ